jgi:hypothetical protein
MVTNGDQLHPKIVEYIISRKDAIYRAFNDRGNPAAAWIGHNIPHISLL